MKTLVCFFLILPMLACNKNNNAFLDDEMKRPIRQLKNFNGDTSLPLEQRILKAPFLLLNYISTMDNTDQYEPYGLSETEKKLFMQYYHLLPKKFQSVIQQKVVAIYFIKNFTGGGMSDFLFDQKGEMYMVLYLNPETLNTNLTDWIDFRDNSSFSPDNKGITLTSDCGKEYVGLLHTLVHEAAHVYDYYQHVTPYVEPTFKFVSLQKSPRPFTEKIWDDYRQPLPEYDFPHRKTLSTYGLGKKLPLSFAPELYKSLSQTPFSSLYGTSIWAEDFAETFTWFYLAHKLKINYVIRIFQGENKILHYIPGENKKVSARYSQFNDLLE